MSMVLLMSFLHVTCERVSMDIRKSLFKKAKEMSANAWKGHLWYFMTVFTSVL